MLFFVEVDHVRPAGAAPPEAGVAFIEQVIFPTLARAEELAKAKTIVAGGPVAGRIALRLMIEADSAEEVDRIVTSLPLWTVAETRVTPLISFAERRTHVQVLRERLGASR
jgi:muconolactone delta-isomerase